MFKRCLIAAIVAIAFAGMSGGTAQAQTVPHCASKRCPKPQAPEVHGPFGLRSQGASHADPRK